MAQAPPPPAQGIEPAVPPGQQWLNEPDLPQGFEIGVEHFAQTISVAIWNGTLGGRKKKVIQSMCIPVAVQGVDVRALQHAVRLWRRWREPTRAELSARPWRGSFGRHKGVWKKKHVKGQQGPVADRQLKTFAFVLNQPR